jgi:hypothetical protein
MEWANLLRVSAVVTNWDKSASVVCHDVAAGVSKMFCNFYSVKNHKIANNLTIAEVRAK